jgi:hypothetical protein
LDDLVVLLLVIGHDAMRQMDRGKVWRMKGRAMANEEMEGGKVKTWSVENLGDEGQLD